MTKARTGEQTKIDGQPHASHRNRIRIPAQSVCCGGRTGEQTKIDGQPHASHHPWMR